MYVSPPLSFPLPSPPSPPLPSPPLALFPLPAQMDNQVVVNDYAQMDRILKEERQYILNICKAIKKAGCNVLLIQKSILRDAVNDLALHFLAKMKIMVVRDVERDDVEFICRVSGRGEWVGPVGGRCE